MCVGCVCVCVEGGGVEEILRKSMYLNTPII